MYTEQNYKRKWIAFTDPMATKAFHSHSPMLWRQCQPHKAQSNSSGAAGVRCLAHGHLNTWSGGTRDWTTNLLVCRQPEPRSHFRNNFVLPIFHELNSKI